jgi:hypothetical protein
MKKNIKNKKKKGVAAIEAALVLPVFILITLAGLQYGWLFLKYQEITNIARHAIRYCSRPDVGCPETHTWIEAEMAKHGFTSDMIVENIVQWVPGGPDYDPPGDVGNAIEVKLSIDAEKVDIINFLPVPAKLTAYCTMSEEGNPDE